MTAITEILSICKMGDVDLAADLALANEADPEIAPIAEAFRLLARWKETSDACLKFKGTGKARDRVRQHSNRLAFQILFNEASASADAFAEYMMTTFRMPDTGAVDAFLNGDDLSDQGQMIMMAFLNTIWRYRGRKVVFNFEPDADMSRPLVRLIEAYMKAMRESEIGKKFGGFWGPITIKTHPDGVVLTF